jgi:hypothetical protein
VETLFVNSVKPVQVELILWRTLKRPCCILVNCVNPVCKNSVNPVQVELTDFVGNPEAARGNINAWVEKLTKGHIKDLGRERKNHLVRVHLCLLQSDSPLRRKKAKLLPIFLAYQQKSRFGGFGFLCISYQYICEMST